jgi:hypothetical protein
MEVKEDDLVPVPTNAEIFSYSILIQKLLHGLKLTVYLTKSGFNNTQVRIPAGFTL